MVFTRLLTSLFFLVPKITQIVVQKLGSGHFPYNVGLNCPKTAKLVYPEKMNLISPSLPHYFSLNTTTVSAVDLEARIVILLSALLLQENNCNEETTSSIFLVYSTPLLIIVIFLLILFEESKLVNRICFVFLVTQWPEPLATLCFFFAESHL